MCVSLSVAIIYPSFFFLSPMRVWNALSSELSTQKMRYMNCASHSIVQSESKLSHRSLLDLRVCSIVRLYASACTSVCLSVYRSCISAFVPVNSCPRHSRGPPSYASMCVISSLRYSPHLMISRKRRSFPLSVYVCLPASLRLARCMSKCRSSYYSHRL